MKNDVIIRRMNSINFMCFVGSCFALLIFFSAISDARAIIVLHSQKIVSFFGLLYYLMHFHYICDYLNSPLVAVRKKRYTVAKVFIIMLYALLNYFAIATPILSFGFAAGKINCLFSTFSLINYYFFVSLLAYLVYTTTYNWLYSVVYAFPICVEMINHFYPRSFFVSLNNNYYIWQVTLLVMNLIMILCVLKGVSYEERY